LEGTFGLLVYWKVFFVLLYNWKANPVQTSSESPIIISSRKFSMDDQMMMDLFKPNYTTDEIREETGAQTFHEEFHVVQLLIG
jgi:hypothetical protein